MPETSDGQQTQSTEHNPLTMNRSSQNKGKSETGQNKEREKEKKKGPVKRIKTKETNRSEGRNGESRENQWDLWSSSSPLLPGVAEHNLETLKTQSFRESGKMI